jgi:Calcineurin-like phosphoesterase
MLLRFFLFAVLLCPALAAAERGPIVVDRDAAPEALYAIGDAHGDVDRLSKLLSAVHLANGVTWTGGRSVLVVTGDMIDKGPHSVAVLRLLAALRKAAPDSGGQVIVLSGNHEAEFLADPRAGKAEDFIADLKKAGYTPEKVAACEGDIGEFLCSLPYAARVGDWFFSHGGNTAGRSIAQIDRDIRKGLEEDGPATKQLTGATSILEARLGEGKVWFASPDEHGLLASYADALGVKHMVQGHQHNEVRFADGVERHTGEMFQRWGLLFLIDVGMSEGVGDSRGAALRIADGKATAVCSDGKETLLWQEAGAMQFGRAAPCKAATNWCRSPCWRP